MPRRLLFISNLFPDADQPIRGLDNATLLQALADSGDFTIRVLALRPRVPLLPRNRSGPEPRPGDESLHPVFVPVRYLPKIGSRWNDRLARRDLERTFGRVVAEFRPDAVLASWLYPDGCAAASLCADFGLPLVLVTQGTDTHQYLARPVRRRRIVTACGFARRVICRSGDLAGRLSRAGVAPTKLRVIYNGVDTQRFHPGNRTVARRQLGLDLEEPVLLYVGNLLPVKNPGLLLDAFGDMAVGRQAEGRAPGRLVMIGTGPLQTHLKRQAISRGLDGRILFLGRQPPETVAEWMRAADLLCLSSWNEGFPNVILEALASGLPVVATEVGGIRERIGGPGQGYLVPPGDRLALCQALGRQLAEGRKDGAFNPFPPPCLDWPSAARDYAKVLCDAISDSISA